ncbi:MAG: queuosine precursor transporter [Rickettsiaceae bacterium]|nr:queuosine precursor transporter [Rickettsiaceae bacterium]
MKVNVNNKLKHLAKLQEPMSILAGKFNRGIFSLDYNLTFYYLSIAFVLFLTLSNIAVTKLCNFFGYIMPGGMIFFPLLYVINDVVTEVYGFQKSRKMIFWGMFATIIVNLLLYIVVLLPSAQGAASVNAFDQIFSLSPRVFGASLISYFIGENINAIILTILRRKLNGRIFISRALLSTLIGSFIEGSMFFSFIFWNILDFPKIIDMTLTTSIAKVLIEILVMPISILLIKLIRESDAGEQYNFSA